MYVWDSHFQNIVRFLLHYRDRYIKITAFIIRSTTQSVTSLIISSSLKRLQRGSLSVSFDSVMTNDTMMLITTQCHNSCSGVRQPQVGGCFCDFAQSCWKRRCLGSPPQREAVLKRGIAGNISWQPCLPSSHRCSWCSSGRGKVRSWAFIVAGFSRLWWWLGGFGWVRGWR